METIRLNNGVVMPLLGFGALQLPTDQTDKLITEAIEVGYRMIDTAQSYYNEEGVGRGIRYSSVPRDLIFLSDKIWITNDGESRAARSIDDSLRRLNTDYIDLLLIHMPYGDYYGTYRAMEATLKAGKARAIGVCNFYEGRLYDLASHFETKPAIDQMETHVFNQQQALQQMALGEFGTHIMAWGPFAEGTQGIFTDPVLTSIGEEHGKTAAQVALRYSVQRGIPAIPKSSRRERMAQNLDIFDFRLTEEEMKQIAALDLQRSSFPSHESAAMVKMMMDYEKNYGPKNK